MANTPPSCTFVIYGQNWSIGLKNSKKEKEKKGRSTIVLGRSTMHGVRKVYHGVRNVYHGEQWTSGLTGLGGHGTIYGDKTRNTKTDTSIP